ncbi:MAG: serine/threonine protein phosphatase [Oleibacter sp.]|nr:serine/threonine protein phosphatase [Thalassolituus sp.]|tara:strand:+ start:62 stop:841 length:780 start_codon:yes stop_codon:yes gene_type:complete
MQKLHWESVAKTDIGTVRKINEDQFFDDDTARIWCVADGMGGHERGDLASQLIAQALADLTSQGQRKLTVGDITESLQATNKKLVEMSSKHGSIVGSTVVVLLLTATQAHCIWAGDSRIYRVRNKRIQRLTRDHSQVEDMVDAGLIKPEEAEFHPKANVITRAMGACQQLDLEYKSFDLLPSDRFLLCSDGLNKVLNDHEIEYLMQHTKPASIAEEFIDIALSRRVRDNVTVVAVHNPNETAYDTLHTLPLDSTLPLNL